MKEKWDFSTIKHILRDIPNTRIGVIGDFCLDTYFIIDSTKSEISIETGLKTKPVYHSRFMPGGAGNVANNLLSIGITEVKLFGVLGDDPFGSHLHEILSATEADTEGLILQEHAWNTHVYIKTIENERETGRIDFGNFNTLQKATADRLIQIIREDVHNLDVIIINQQQKTGIHTDYFRRELNTIITDSKEPKFILDSRDYPFEFPHASRKLNQFEGKKVFERSFDGKSKVQKYKDTTELAADLFTLFRAPLFLTLGENGCIVADDTGCRHAWGLQIIGDVDTVGAGDSFLAGCAAALGCGYDNYTAAVFGNLVAGVTVQKLKQTGTAKPEEILSLGREPEFIYRPELASDLRKASYFQNSDVEIITSPTEKPHFAYAIFDHDGTISTLRQGWEKIMKPMMVESILGKHFKTVDAGELQHIEDAVADFIDKTTGVQTLIQMKGLIDMVKKYGYVAEHEIKNESEYKHIYNEKLMQMVDKRINRFKEGQRNIQDYTIKNSVLFLKELQKRGITLFLASGTDEGDVKREAEILGYSSLFSGGIYGAVGNIDVDPKKEVISRILDEIGESNGGRIITFGDGPVEMRETVKAGGYAVGIASDEIRRYGLDEKKRERLILAGADVIIPDFSHLGLLTDLLFRE